MKVYVHWNLRKKLWSVLSGGRVFQHSQQLWLKDVDFIVRKAGFERMKREKRRNVHAFGRGSLMGGVHPICNTVAVRYNRELGHFEANGRKILGAEFALFCKSGTVIAAGLRYGE